MSQLILHILRLFVPGIRGSAARVYGAGSQWGLCIHVPSCKFQSYGSGAVFVGHARRDTARGAIATASAAGMSLGAPGSVNQAPGSIYTKVPEYLRENTVIDGSGLLRDPMGCVLVYDFSSVHYDIIDDS